MRVNATKTLEAFKAGKSYEKASSFWTDGKALFSYATCLLAKTDAGTLVFNDTKYSRTTSVYQHSITTWLRDNMPTVEVMTVKDARMNISEYRLLAWLEDTRL